MLGYIRTSDTSQTGLRCLCTPHPAFYPRTSWLRRAQIVVALVVIPALAPTLDKSPKGDRSLCPVRALRYYLDRTSDLRQNKELAFFSFKKGFDKDISPATISAWIKQTMILCYELSDQKALTLHQVKAHYVRAFAASKAFQYGVSLEQTGGCMTPSHSSIWRMWLGLIQSFSIWGQWLLLNGFTTKNQNEEICKYVHIVYTCI